MPYEPIQLNCVEFWDCASEQYIEVGPNQAVCDMALVPQRGDRLRFPGHEREFSVLGRQFNYVLGGCHVIVQMQPADREK